MSLFKRNVGNDVGKVIVEYVNSILPKGVTCSETIGDSETPSLTLMTHASGRRIEFEVPKEQSLKELSEVDQLHIIKQVVIPVLKQLDKDLFEAHNNIQQKIKELESM